MTEDTKPPSPEAHLPLREQDRLNAEAGAKRISDFLDGAPPENHVELVDFVKSMRDGHAHRTDDYGGGYVDAMNDVLEAISSIASREGSSIPSPVTRERGE